MFNINGIIVAEELNDQGTMVRCVADSIVPEHIRAYYYTINPPVEEADTPLAVEEAYLVIADWGSWVDIADAPWEGFGDRYDKL